MTKREVQELVGTTQRVVERWSVMSHADRTARLKAAGMLDDAGELSQRYWAPSKDDKPRAAWASRSFARSRLPVRGSRTE